MITEAGYHMSYILDAFMQNITFVAFGYVLVAPFVTTREIRRQKTVGDLPSATFMSLLSNCSLSTMYGVLIWDYPIIGANSLGVLAGCYFTWTYWNYGFIPLRNYLIAAFLPGVSLVCALTLHYANAVLVVGILQDVSCTAMMASPLVATRQVIRLKDSTSMPFQTSLAFFINGVTWGSYGIFIIGDLFVIIPNAIGAAVALMQLVVIVIYPPQNKESDIEGRGKETGYQTTLQ